MCNLSVVTERFISRQLCVCQRHYMISTLLIVKCYAKDKPKKWWMHQMRHAWKRTLPHKESASTISWYSMQHGLLFKSHLPGHLRKKKRFAISNKVLPQALTSLEIHAYQDHALSGGHPAFRPTLEKIRQKYWWPSITQRVMSQKPAWSRPKKSAQ